MDTLSDRWARFRSKIRTWLLIVVRNNSMRTNYVKTKLDNSQKNSKCRLCGDRDEIVNRIISECSKLAQKEFKIRHDLVEKVILYMKKSEFIQNNET